MKLADWARQQQVDYKTAYRWFRAGILPVPSRQLPTGTILVDQPAQRMERAALYARVSSGGQRADLDRQLARLVQAATDGGMSVGASVAEIGSGLNGRRPKLARILADPSVTVVVVEHRDRLARFGSEYVEAALAAGGRRLVVLDKDELKDDLVRDMIDVLTSFCARLYGKRSARNKARKVVEDLEKSP